MWFTHMKQQGTEEIASPAARNDRALVISLDSTEAAPHNRPQQGTSWDHPVRRAGAAGS